LPRNVLTARDLEAIPKGGEITITPESLVTPLARDEAEARGITIRVVEPASGESNRGRIVAIGADHGGYELKEQLEG